MMGLEIRQGFFQAVRTVAFQPDRFVFVQQLIQILAEQPGLAHFMARIRILGQKPALAGMPQHVGCQGELTPDQFTILALVLAMPQAS